jgi:DNA polymerase-3 subunit delta
MIIVRDMIASSKKETDWVDNLEKIPTSNILVLWETLEPKELEKRSLFKKLEKISEIHFYPFPKLEGAALSKWAGQRVAGCGATIAPEALDALVERAGEDLWQLDGEIQKLIAYADGQQISKAMVDQLVRASSDGNIFALMDAVASHNARQVLRLLEEERASGATDGYIFSMLLRQIRILLSTRLSLDENPRPNQNEIAAALNLHPFVAGKAVQQARGVSTNKLRRVHDLLYALDTGMKSGRYSDSLSVDLAIVELLK